MNKKCILSSSGDVHGGNLNFFKKTFCIRKLPAKIIDFSVNINLKGPPPSVKRFLRKLSYKDCITYPDPDGFSTRKALAQSLKIPFDEISAANGSTELFSALLNALKPEKIIIAAPAYTGYEEVASIFNIPTVYQICAVETNNFTFNLNSLKPKKNDLIFICTPNNPTGSIIEKNHIIKLANKFPHTNIAIDESFLDYLPNPAKYSFFTGNIPNNIIAFKSLTKFFGIPGIRLGMCRANKSLVSLIQTKIPPWNINSIAQKIAPLLFSDKTYLENTKKQNIIVREKFTALLKGLPLKIFPSHTNFVLCKLLSEKSNKKVIKYLLSKGFLVRDCSKIPGLNEQFIRIAILSDTLNHKLAREIKNYFSKS